MFTRDIRKQDKKYLKDRSFMLQLIQNQSVFTEINHYIYLKLKRLYYKQEEDRVIIKGEFHTNKLIIANIFAPNNSHEQHKYFKEVMKQNN